MVRAVAALLLAGLASSAAPAQAQTCSLTKLAALDLTPVAGGARMLVPVSINGRPEHLLLGTAGGSSTLTRATVKALDLQTHYSEGGRLLDAKGYASDHYLRVASFQIGDYLRARDMPMMVTPDPDAGADPPLDGILAIDVMSHYDIEIDFAARKLNYFSQDHCPGRVVYWPAAIIGVTPIMKMSRAEDHHARSGPVVQHVLLSGAGAFDDPSWQTEGPHVFGTDMRMRVELDGKSFTANIDTGSETSTLNSAIARAVFDVTAASPRSSPAGSISTNPNSQTGAGETVVVNGSRIFEHSFHTLSFGGVTVTNPHFTVRPQMMGANDRYNDFILGSHIERVDDNLEPDVTIGMNILKDLHLYIAFGEGRIYVTAAAPPS